MGQSLPSTYRKVCGAGAHGTVRAAVERLEGLAKAAEQPATLAKAAEGVGQLTVEQLRALQEQHEAGEQVQVSEPTQTVAIPCHEFVGEIIQVPKDQIQA